MRLFLSLKNLIFLNYLIFRNFIMKIMVFIKFSLSEIQDKVNFKQIDDVFTYYLIIFKIVI